MLQENCSQPCVSVILSLFYKDTLLFVTLIIKVTHDYTTIFLCHYCIELNICSMLF